MDCVCPWVTVPVPEPEPEPEPAPASCLGPSQSYIAAARGGPVLLLACCDAASVIYQDERWEGETTYQRSCGGLLVRCSHPVAVSSMQLGARGTAVPW